MEVKGSDTEKKPSQLRKKVQRLKKCSILLVPMAAIPAASLPLC